MKYEIAIAGAGPSGLALAAELRRRGVQPLVIDRVASGANTSRAAVIHARTLEVLEPLGVVPALLENGLVVSTFRVRDHGRVLATIRFDQLPTKYPFALMCPQDRTERILLEKLEALGGSVTRPCALVSAREAGDEVEITYQCGERMETATARWLVGCDGSHSKVREEAGISFEGGAYDESFILADVEMDWPLGRTEVDLFLAADGLVVVAPLPENHFRIVATVNDGGAGDLSIGDFERILRQRGPGEKPIRIEKLAWTSRFRVSHRVAHTFRKGRMLLAGDAAHVHSPAGGQGMNTGIQDAVSLADALSGVLSTGNEAGLDAWEANRRRIAESVVQFTGRLTTMATISSPVLKNLRNMAIEFAGSLPLVEHALAHQLAELDNR